MARSRRNRFGGGWKTKRTYTSAAPSPHHDYVLSRYERPIRQTINYDTAYPLKPRIITGILQHALTASTPSNAVYLGTLSNLLPEAAKGACKLNWESLCAPIPFTA